MYDSFGKLTMLQRTIKETKHDKRLLLWLVNNIYMSGTVKVANLLRGPRYTIFL